MHGRELVTTAVLLCENGSCLAGLRLLLHSRG